MGTTQSKKRVKWYRASTVKSSTLDTPPVRVLTEWRSFVWQIQDFDIVCRDESRVVQQNLQFEAGAALGVPSKWKFYLSWTENAGYGKNIGVHLQLMEKPSGLENIADMNVSFRLNNNGWWWKRKDYFCQSTGTMSEDGDIGFDRVLHAVYSFMPYSRSDKSVKIKLEFVMSPRPNKAIGKLDLAYQVKKFEGRSKDLLSKDLGNMPAMTGNEGNASTLILCKDDKVFPANRGILVARSPVFQRMFANGEFAEAQTGLVKMDDLPSKAVEVMLHYIHTGRLHPDWKKAEVLPVLFMAADKYELTLLLEFLGDVMGLTCSVENVFQLAMLANRLKMTRAEQDLLAFIKQNVHSLDKVKMETEWGL